MFKVPDERHERWEWDEPRPLRTKLMITEIAVWMVILVASLAIWGQDDDSNWTAIGIVMAVMALRLKMMSKSGGPGKG